MPPKNKKKESVGEAISGSAEQTHRMEMAERNEERRILRDLIKAKIGLSKDRANALKKIFETPPANMTEEELQQNDRQRLEGMAEMAMVHLNHAKSSSLNSIIGGQVPALGASSPTRSFGNNPSSSVCEDDLVAKNDAKGKIPEIRVEPPEEDELSDPEILDEPAISRRLEPDPEADLGLYQVYGYPEEGGGYSTAFPKY